MKATQKMAAVFHQSLAYHGRHSHWDRRGALGCASVGQSEVLGVAPCGSIAGRSEEHTSELQSLMRISYAVFCLKKKKRQGMTRRKTITGSTMRRPMKMRCKHRS